MYSLSFKAALTFSDLFLCKLLCRWNACNCSHCIGSILQMLFKHAYGILFYSSNITSCSPFLFSPSLYTVEVKHAKYCVILSLCLKRNDSIYSFVSCSFLFHFYLLTLIICRLFVFIRFAGKLALLSARVERPEREGGRGHLNIQASQMLRTLSNDGNATCDGESTG